MRHVLRKTLWRNTDFQTDSNDNRIEWKLRRIERVLKNVRDFVACQCSKSQTERESDSVNAFMIRFNINQPIMIINSIRYRSLEALCDDDGIFLDAY